MKRTGGKGARARGLEMRRARARGEDLKRARARGEEPRSQSFCMSTQNTQLREAGIPTKCGNADVQNEFELEDGAERPGHIAQLVM